MRNAPNKRQRHKRLFFNNFTLYTNYFKTNFISFIEKAWWKTKKYKLFKRL